MSKNTVLLVDHITDELECILRYISSKGLIAENLYVVQISKHDGSISAKQIISKWNAHYFHVGIPDAIKSLDEIEGDNSFNYANSIIDVLFINRILSQKDKVVLENYSLHYIIPILNKKANCEIYAYINFVPNMFLQISKSNNIFKGVNKIICANNQIKLDLLEKLSISDARVFTFTPTLLNDRTRNSFKNFINSQYFQVGRKKIILLDMTNTEIRYVILFCKLLVNLQRKRFVFNVIMVGVKDVSFLKENFLVILTNLLIFTELDNSSLFYLYKVCDLLVMLQRSFFFKTKYLKIIPTAISVVSFKKYLVLPLSNERRVQLPNSALENDKVFLRSLIKILKKL